MDTPESTRSRRRKIKFWAAFAAVIGLALFLAFVSWVVPPIGGVLIALGSVAKVASTVIAGVSKGPELKDQKSWIEEHVGYIDAGAAICAFPALFTVGAKIAVDSVPGI